MGEAPLFPPIRKSSRDTLLAGCKFACRNQMRGGAGRAARHGAALLKLALNVSE